jgi:hypothetical protein
MTDPSATGFPTAPSWVPAAAPEPQLSRRRHHRFLTLPSSVLIVICMFLPTLEVCGKPVAPVQFPPFYSPYIIAALVFAAALLRPWRVFGIGLALRIVMGATAVGFALPIVFELEAQPLAALAYVLCAIVLAIVIVPGRTHELLVARCATFGGLGSLIWFCVLAADRHALYGAHVSVFAAVMFTVGSAWWWIEAFADWALSAERSSPSR